MFGIGFGELLIIIVVLIIAVGPQQLPSLMRTIGKAIRSMRQASQDLRDSIGLDEFVNRDILSHRPPPYRRVKPESDLLPKDSESIEKDAAPKLKEELPEIDADSPTDSVEITDQAAASAATQVEREDKEKPAEKTGEN
jgi:Tat protein translocase TatB subunit